jgi:tRNA 2-thiouridine synthesizing protein A
VLLEKKKITKKTIKGEKMAQVTLDCLGKKCPMPVLMTKKELKKMDSGDVLELIVNDVGALKDVPALLKRTGDELLDSKEDGERITFHIKKA